MGDERDRLATRRRTLLSAAGSLTGTALMGTTTVTGSESREGRRRCPDATIRPSMNHCEGASIDGCADDDPETIELRARAKETLDERYATVGDLIDGGFRPYFDLKRRGSSNGWSHWLSPEYIGDDILLDPDRPESVLVDNETWRPIGIMFIATENGEPVDPPPPVYRRGRSENAEDRRCSPWHYHRGFPGRFAWKYYRQVYESDGRDGDISLPCRTPCMMHVWTVPHPAGVYAHDAPPPEKRGDLSATEPGFETEVDPSEATLGWGTLPDDVIPDWTPEDLAGW
ncbi:hypothetical protein OB919_20405 [Halobacteria archaeon AArc-curdl1]|uniref:Uncharacterized protein n=1 Tax=Natronosalvus hydrolyticus TaxID=2979988 RepID=A0AAP2ZE54_9EURY|nr:hypothetical protein [Halobacteria archaeon AArc-curdl1]